MAKSITQITKRAAAIEEEQGRAKEEILEAAAKHKESILLLLELVNDLKEAGVLEIAHAFVSNRHQIGVIGINQLNKSGAQNLIKNSMAAVQFLGNMEPGKLELLLGALASGAEAAAPKPDEAKSKRTGLWGMLNALKEAEIQISFGFLLNFLRGMGRFLQRKAL